MTDMHGLLAEIRRPRLLMRAARLGLACYRRERDLRRLVPDPEPDRAMATLLAEERDLERRRQAGEATYSVTHHVEVLIALIAEARLAPPAGCLSLAQRRWRGPSCGDCAGSGRCRHRRIRGGASVLTDERAAGTARAASFRRRQGRTVSTRRHHGKGRGPVGPRPSAG